MPRRPRLTLPNIPLHLIQRGNNRQVCFVADEDFGAYLDWLGEYADKTGCRIHAYVLMTNHVHLLVSAERGDAPGQLMKALGQRYVQYFNRMYRRSGTLWEGRYRSCLTQAEDYLLACQRYIELNPVRAGMVAHPADYRWSSYRANAQGEPDALIQPHAVYRIVFICRPPKSASGAGGPAADKPRWTEPRVRRLVMGIVSLATGRSIAQVA